MSHNITIVVIGLIVVALVAAVTLVLVLTSQRNQRQKPPANPVAVERDTQAGLLVADGKSWDHPRLTSETDDGIPQTDAGVRMAHAARRFLTLALQSDLNVIIVVPHGLAVSTALGGLLELADERRQPIPLCYPVDVIKFITRARGNLGVVEAGEPYAAVAALEALYAESSPALSITQVSETIPAAVDLLVWLYRPGNRAVVVREIAELIFDPEGRNGEGVLVLEPIFHWDPAAGELHATGVRPRSLSRIEAGGLRASDSLFIQQPI